MWASIGANRSPRKYHRGSSCPDKNNGCTKRPQALAIVLMVHTYSPTVIADWNHRTFPVISLPKNVEKKKGQETDLRSNLPFVRSHEFFFSSYFYFPSGVSICRNRMCLTCKQSPSLNQRGHCPKICDNLLFSQILRCVFLYLLTPLSLCVTKAYVTTTMRFFRNLFHFPFCKMETRFSGYPLEKNSMNGLAVRITR